MVVLALVVVALTVIALLVAARAAREAARDAIVTIGVARRELRPALVLARDDARRAATMRPPHRQ
jgi:hypothetical protein